MNYQRFFALAALAFNISNVSAQPPVPVLVPEDTPYIIMVMQWSETSVPLPEVHVRTPAGDVIKQADFAANLIAPIPQLNRPGRAAYYVGAVPPGSLSAGAWALEPISTENLGQVTLTATPPTGGIDELMQLMATMPK